VNVAGGTDEGILARADCALTWAEKVFVGGALAFASLLLFINVLLRYLFLAPISWAEELSLYLMAWIVFVGSSAVIRARGHIAIDLLPLVLPPAGRRLLAIAVSFAMLVFLAVFFYYSFHHTLRVHSIAQVTPVMQAPMWLAYLAMPVGSALMFLRTCQLVFGLVRSGQAVEPHVADMRD
jgi:C4-dicarboxylate transporter DctQ subunit